jgi:large subunit ribosomal protein L6
MSKIGRQIIPLAGATVEVRDGLVVVKGPKGELKQQIKKEVTVEVKDDHIVVTVAQPDNQQQRALWGLYRALIANMVTGVTKGFTEVLEINGVGFRAEMKGSKIVLALGFSHPVEFSLPVGVEAKIEKNVVTMSGIDKHLVGQTAANLRALKKPEPYKGKGIKYASEVVRRKAGKQVKS